MGRYGAYAPHTVEYQIYEEKRPIAAHTRLGTVDLEPGSAFRSNASFASELAKNQLRIDLECPFWSSTLCSARGRRGRPARAAAPEGV